MTRAHHPRGLRRPLWNSSKADAEPTVNFLRRSEVGSLLALADELPVLAAIQLLRYLYGTTELGQAAGQLGVFRQEAVVGALGLLELSGFRGELILRCL